MKISNKEIKTIEEARQHLRLLYRPLNERRKELRGLWFNYNIWMFDIVMVLSFMSYGIFLLIGEFSLFFSLVVIVVFSYLVGMVLHEATCGEYWKKIQKLNKQEEK